MSKSLQSPSTSRCFHFDSGSGWCRYRRRDAPPALCACPDVHVSPESVDVQMFPPETEAAAWCHHSTSDVPPVLRARPGCPRRSRVRRRPDVSTRDSGSELGAVTRRRDTPPVLRACPGCPRLSRVYRCPDGSTNDSSGELGAITRRRDDITGITVQACLGCPRRSRVRRRPDVSTRDSGSELGAVTRRRDESPVLWPSWMSTPSRVVDVQMFPPMTVTASLVPSLDDVMAYQLCVLSVGLTSVLSRHSRASEANKSNAVSRTRMRAALRFTGIVSPLFKVSRN